MSRRRARSRWGSSTWPFLPCWRRPSWPAVPRKPSRRPGPSGPRSAARRPRPPPPPLRRRPPPPRWCRWWTCSPSARRRPRTTPAALAAQITAAEQSIRDPDASESAVATAALAQQVAYRQLGTHPEWDAAVAAALPAELRGGRPAATPPPAASSAGCTPSCRARSPRGGSSLPSRSTAWWGSTRRRKPPSASRGGTSPPSTSWRPGSGASAGRRPPGRRVRCSSCPPRGRPTAPGVTSTTRATRSSARLATSPPTTGLWTSTTRCSGTTTATGTYGA